MEIIGQSKLVSLLFKHSLTDFPKTILLLGERGCGKQFFAKKIAEKFELEFKLIDESVSKEDLINYSQCVVPTLFSLDLSKFTEKQQNQFLKFIEEPALNVFIVCTAESEAGLLPTILNRCIKYYFEPYTPEQLQKIGFDTYAVDSIYYKICNTPGKLMDESEESIKNLYQFCQLLVSNIDKASWANTIKILTKINYKEDYNKFDFNLFFDTLEYVSFEKYSKENNPLSFIIYTTTNAAKNNLINKVVNKESFMINFLTELWKVTR